MAFRTYFSVTVPEGDGEVRDKAIEVADRLTRGELSGAVQLSNSGGPRYPENVFAVAASLLGNRGEDVVRQLAKQGLQQYLVEVVEEVDTSEEAPEGATVGWAQRVARTVNHPQ